MARASRKRASAIFRFWLPAAACSSSAVSCASPNVSHHFGGSDGAPGCAVFQSFVSLKLSGGASLNTAGTGVTGLAYFGPTVQPEISRADAIAGTHRFVIARFVIAHPPAAREQAIRFPANPKDRG